MPILATFGKSSRYSCLYLGFYKEMPLLLFIRVIAEGLARRARPEAQTRLRKTPVQTPIAHRGQRLVHLKKILVARGVQNIVFELRSWGTKSGKTRADIYQRSWKKFLQLGGVQKVLLETQQLGDKKWQNVCRHLPVLLEKILEAKGGLDSICQSKNEIAF